MGVFVQNELAYFWHIAKPKEFLAEALYERRL